MTIKVLVVDDSSFFRRRVSEIINASPALEVIATANNGQEAIEMVIKYKPDVVTMDIEMPVMNGITAVQKIMASTPVPILMFSSLTHQGASATLDALEAGACDFLPKKFEDIARDKEEATTLLQQRIQTIARRRVYRVAEKTAEATHSSVSHSVNKPSIVSKPITAGAASPSLTALQRANERQQISAKSASNSNLSSATVAAAKPMRTKASGKSYKVLAIGTSTGGPVALQKILTALPSDFKLPIVLIQHMPGTFTKAFAERLNSNCRIAVKEAENGDILRAGCAYLAPGGKQMMVGPNGQIKILDGSPALNYKPSVDITFASLSKSYADKVLAIVLTGMGADGRDGARLLKDKGAEIWAQDEASCVVYGMPQAVTKAGIATESIALEQVAKRILVELKHE
ncbi:MULTISPECIES: chemotaxis response regulator protein-glutamate methylesterase [Psychromonas]|uniref:protein-glutamate methylesterase/protein-glutamine glutaminase n=1 Tax=Psychromonas TaxID=67572 RepID=UPI000404FA97|nr:MULTISPECIES: chemotaxis response regulator protein-glutamate methylesterase [Psychromonas]MBB1271668.1 chemotaxis response regulator protein-glutamate methylesterase [Psychromonas sp. SR45-3]